MAVLLTGGTGKTSLPIAHFLQDAKIPFLLASRKGAAAAPSGMPATTFDWLDASTFKTPFEHRFPSGDLISAVYLIAPVVPDPVPSMNAFIDFAVHRHGVKRFVLLAGGTVEKGGFFVGKVWEHLVEIGVEYCVLRPSWFMENLREEGYLETIRGEGKIYTACGDGKVPFVSAKDIGNVAFHALTDKKPHNTDYRVLGPELLTYDDIAAKFSSCLGRNIVHVKLSGEEKAKLNVKSGVPEHYAKMLASLEVAVAGGEEERSNDAVARVTGRPPQKFDAWMQQNKAVWE